MIDKQALTLDCKHNQFHAKCIKDWLEISPDCPLCKKGVDFEQIEQLKPNKIIHKIWGFQKRYLIVFQRFKR